MQDFGFSILKEKLYAIWPEDRLYKLQVTTEEEDFPKTIISNLGKLTIMRSERANTQLTGEVPYMQ